MMVLHRMERLERTAATLSTALAIGGLIALMALAAMTLADGMARWLVDRPIQGVRDVGSLVIAVAIACCIPASLVERSNITIRLLEKWSVKGAGVLDAIASAVVAIVLAAIAWQFLLHAANVSAAGETTWVLHLPTAPFWWLIDVLLWCAVAIQCVVAAADIARVSSSNAEREVAP